MQIEFYKYQGTGNDFIILDNRQDKYKDLTDKQVKQLCDRHFGIGADGLMLLNLKAGYDFEMVYYNADGKPSSMCGNGGRCLVKFASLMGINKTNYHFSAVDGDHEAEIDLNGWVRLKMSDVHEVDVHSSYFLVNTGSPHYVKLVRDVMKMDVRTEGKSIRQSKGFEEEGINVNFVETKQDDKIYVRTYERGVEDETLSCGTGVTASAIVCSHNDNGFNRVEVQTPGGNLSVEYDKLDDNRFENIWLAGPAELVFKGTMAVI